METNKIHERILEIQKNLETASPEQKNVMTNELLTIASQIEQSLAELKIDLDNKLEELNDEE